MESSTTTQGQLSSILTDRRGDPTTPPSYFSKLPVRLGALFGVMGSLLIMIVIAVLTLTMGEDLWRSPRIIASLVMGSASEVGILPVFIGTALHLIAGAVYGSIFARIIPRLPRPIWIVVGILYGVMLWIIATYTLPLFVNTGDISSANYFGGLLIAHIVFGINLGLAGALYGLSNVRNMSY